MLPAKILNGTSIAVPKPKTQEEEASLTSLRLAVT